MNKLCEEFPEIANLLEYIVEYEEKDPVKRSERLRVIQKHAEKALNKLEESHAA